MYFAYRGINVLVLAPIMAAFAILWHVDTPMFASYTQVFMPALGNYLLKYFPIFMLGAIFGRLMNDSGAALVIGRFIAGKIGADRAILATVLACAILTYGGVSLFVVAFCIFPIATSLFREAQIPKRFIPASIALGSFTFTMTALPGTPAIQNAIPMPFFGTTTFAAPWFGLYATLVMFVGGIYWLNRRAQKAKDAGEGYLPLNEQDAHEEAVLEDRPLGNIWFAFLPLILVLALNYLFSELVFPQFDFSYLAEEPYGPTTPQKVIGLWSLIGALGLSILPLIGLQFKRLSNPLASVNKGTMESMLPIFNTASEVGYGATIASLTSFTLIKNGILGIAPQYPLISEAISINVLAGITGSASGGLSIALQALAENYMSMAAQAGISPEILHKVATLSCGGFDSLPHNGAVITLLGICGLTHKKSYYDIFIVAVIIPFATTISVVAMASF